MLSLSDKIWKMVFSNLNKKEIKVVLSVCTSWRKLASCFVPDTIHISLKDYQFQRLLEDLLDYPGFSVKVNEITVASDDTNDSPLILQFILNQCCNLLVLKFTKTKICEYLRVLDSSETKLPNIQKIDIMHLAECTTENKTLAVVINYRFRATIKSLDLMQPSNRGFISYGSLEKYLSDFSQLTNIKIWNFKAQCLDLNELLKCNNNLETVDIKGTGISLFGDLSMLSSTIEYPSLRKLCLHGFKADISVLTYINSRFVRLEELSFTRITITRDETVSLEAAQQIIRQFIPSTVTSHHFSFHLKGNPIPTVD